MAAVLGHGHAIGALHRCHSLNRDITGSAKCPPGKQTHSHWAVETLCIDVRTYVCTQPPTRKEQINILLTDMYISI